MKCPFRNLYQLFSPCTLSDLRVIRLKPHREARTEWHKILAGRVGRHNLVQWFVLNSSCACEWWRPAAIVAHNLALQVNDGRWKVKIQHRKWVGWHSIQLRDIRSVQHGTHRRTKSDRLAFSLIYWPSYWIQNRQSHSHRAYEYSVWWLVLADM